MRKISFVILGLLLVLPVKQGIGQIPGDDKTPEQSRSVVSNGPSSQNDELTQIRSEFQGILDAAQEHAATASKAAKEAQQAADRIGSREALDTWQRIDSTFNATLAATLAGLALAAAAFVSGMEATIRST